MKKRSRFSYPLTTKANKRIKYNSEVGTVDDGTASFRLTELIKEKKKLTTELSEKEDCLHKLQLVKLYRSKNNLDQLERLIEKWREASQEAAADLIGMTTADPPPTMAEMLNYLHINPLDIHYSVEDQEFY
jgi:protein subunit release factor A